MRNVFSLFLVIALLSGCASNKMLPAGTLDAAVAHQEEFFRPFALETPEYGLYCGNGNRKPWREHASVEILPQDSLDALCWLHDAETSHAMRYESDWKKLLAWNAASKNFGWRIKHQDDVANFASLWWSAKLGLPVTIAVAPYDADYQEIYRPGARKLFRFLYVPFLRSKGLLAGAIDETLAGPPPPQE